MLVLIFQSAILILAAFVIGVVIGCYARGVRGTSAPAQMPAVEPATTGAPAILEGRRDHDGASGFPNLRRAAVRARQEAQQAALLGGSTAPPDDTGAQGATDIAAATGRPPAQPRPEGKLDNLKRIRGIGKKTEKMLHKLGIYRFAQIAAWSPAQGAWMETYLHFPGRIEREDWIGQADILAKGGDTAFSKRVDQGEIPTSTDQ